MLLLNLLINGIQLGALYALMALGFAIIFGTTRVFHYAHAASYVIAAYAYYWLHEFAAWPWWAAAVLAVSGVILFGTAVNKYIYAAIQRDNAAFFTLFVASFGITIVIVNLITLIFGGGIVFVSSPLTAVTEVADGLFVSWFGMGVVVVAAIAFAAVQWYFRNTDNGLALRALNESPELVRAFGLHPGRLSFLAFAIGSALAGPAAIANLYIGGIVPSSGERILLISMAATIIGGVGSLKGAGIGGLLLGVTESISSWQLPTAWSNTISFVVLLVFILLWPYGLFGKRVRV